MEKLKRHMRILFWTALTLSIGFPVGVVCIVFGATKGIIPLLVCGIIVAICGFYIMPILWVQYGVKFKYKTLLRLIEEENLYSVEELSNQTNFDQKQIRDMINYLILANYLTGYIFHNDTLELNTKQKQKPKSITKKCPACGALMAFDSIKFHCDYCGTTER